MKDKKYYQILDEYMLLHGVLGCKEKICNMQHTIFLSNSLVFVSSYNVLQRSGVWLVWECGATFSSPDENDPAG